MSVTLEAALARGRAAWPEVGLDGEQLGGYLAARGHHPPFDEALPLEDLFLACACLGGNPAALRHLERAVLFPLGDTLRSFHDADEVVQRVRERLLVGPGGQPKLSEYRGHGGLLKWARVVAVRVALSMSGEAPKDEPIDSLFEHAAPDDSPEVKVLKARHGKDLAGAFTAAVARLSAKERNLLRLSLIDRVSIDQIGVLYGAHRSSAARWVNQAREKLAGETRRELAARLELTDSQVDSLMGVLRSQVDLSINRLLHE